MDYKHFLGVDIWHLTSILALPDKFGRARRSAPGKCACG